MTIFSSQAGLASIRGGFAVPAPRPYAGVPLVAQAAPQGQREGVKR